jgi:tyrosine-specific transport protein
MTNLRSRVWGSAFLVTGTCIGAAMLTLPVLTARLGPIGAVASLVTAWFFMYLTGKMTLQALLCSPRDATFITMVSHILPHKIITMTVSVTFLLLLYSLVSLYFTGVVDLLEYLLPRFSLSLGYVQITSLLALSMVVMLSAALWAVDWLNRFLGCCLVACFACLVLVLLPHSDWSAVVHWQEPVQPRDFWWAFPMLLTSFGYHVVLPTVRHYTHSDVSSLNKIIYYGSLLPLLVYLLWTLLVFCVLPTSGSGSLVSLQAIKSPLVTLVASLSALIHQPWMAWVARGFILLAMSLQTVMQRAVQRVVKTPLGVRRLIATLLVFVPPWLVVCVFHHAFMWVLMFASVIVIYLHGVIPAAMMWRLRRVDDSATPKALCFWHHRWLIGVVMCVSLLLITSELLHLIASKVVRW